MKEIPRIEKRREIPNTNEIENFLHCGKCLKELPAEESPSSYARYDIGYTIMGLQIWCKRHDCNVLHMDFEGHKFHANLS